MNVLGIHDGHNASACLLEDGKLTWAVQEERYTQRKNQAGLPVSAIRKILARVDYVDVVALASYFIHKPEWYHEQGFWEQTKKDYIINKLVWPFKKRFNPYYSQRTEQRVKQLANFLRREAELVPRIHVVEHHRAHAASAFYGSHYEAGERVTVLTADGSGDGVSASVSVGDEEGRLTRGSTSGRDASIGQIYSLTTYILGFRPWEHEYKLMGLAPYGRSSAELYKALCDLVYFVDGMFAANRSTKFAYDYLSRLYRNVRFDVICATLQRWFEDMMRTWVDNMPSGRFACAGGDFMNVKANQQIASWSKVEDLFIMPSCGDESTSIGAAMMVQAMDCLEHGEHPKRMIEPIKDLGLGPELDPDEALFKGFEWWRESDPDGYIVDLLSKGEIVARCSGRMEFGARALGNRSILCDPSQLQLKDELNRQVKHRDFWMPFAPVLMEGLASEYIVNPKELKASFMVLAFDSTPKAQTDFMGAIHPFDYSLRPQLVDGYEYGVILDDWLHRSGIGGLLNTSFNKHGYPIVRGVEQALWTLENTGLQHLVLNDIVLVKE